MQIDTDSININDFKPDIETLNQNIHLGPQADILERIEEFNEKHIGYTRSRYNLRTNTKKLGITKKYYWKPGAYDSIRECIITYNELNKKSNSISKFINRARENSPYRLRELYNDIADIESILMSYRIRGMVMQDNTEDIIKAWDFIKEHLIKQQNDSKFKIEAFEIIKDDILVDYCIVVVYNYLNPVMHYHINGVSEPLADIEIAGEYDIMIKMPLSKLLNIIVGSQFDFDKINNNQMISQRVNRTRWTYRLSAKYDAYEGIYHPYISTNAGGFGNFWNDSDRYVCAGNMEENIQACLRSLDFKSVGIFIDRIMSYYDTNTGPLNNIKTAYHGRPKFLENNEMYEDIIAQEPIERCRYKHFIKDEPDVDWIKNDSYCVKYCTATAKCPTFQDRTRQLTPEEVTQKALEHATIQAATRR